MIRREAVVSCVRGTQRPLHTQMMKVRMSVSEKTGSCFNSETNVRGTHSTACMPRTQTHTNTLKHTHAVTHAKVKNKVSIDSEKNL